MNIDAKTLKRKKQIKSNNVNKELYTITKLDLFQVYKTGSTFENQFM